MYSKAIHPRFRAGAAAPRKRARSEPPPQHWGPVVRYTNCRVVRDHKLLEEDLWVQGGVIVDPQRLFWEARQADETVECGGMILAPGFIDVQLNGGFGADFSTEEGVGTAVETVSQGVLQHGVTAYVATVITSSAEAYATILPQLTPRAGRKATPSLAGAAAMLGVHLEGPFISREKSGCHPLCYVQDEAPKGGALLLRGVYNEHLAHVRIVTLAPELPGADEIIDELVARKIVVAVGHSSASVAQTEAAMLRGATMCTHMFNAMPPFSAREPGVIGALGLTSRRPFFGLIADGVHVHPASLKIAAAARRDRVVLVTDSMAAMGLPPGTYRLGNVSVIVEEKDGTLRATRQGSDTLAGAVVTMDECVRRYREYCDASVVEAVEAASLHPAQALGIEGSKGSLAIGADADLVLLDDELRVQRTYIGGSLAWQRAE